MPPVEAEDDIPPAVRELVARLSRCPWVWDVLLQELDDQREKKAHFRLRLDLTGAFGGVVDALVRLRRDRRRALDRT